VVREPARSSIHISGNNARAVLLREQALFCGIGAVVIGIILRSTIKLGRATLKKNPLLWTIFFVLAISTAYTGSEIIWLCGVLIVLPLWERR
jgi:chromate transport protein ChrA